MNNCEPLKDCLTAHLELIEAIIDRSIPSKGNTGTECTRTALLQSLAVLDTMINGIESDDLNEDADWGLLNSANKLIRNQNSLIDLHLSTTKQLNQIASSIN
jgi:hypothetical protein